LALDHLLAHPNVAPFVSKQLIQKFVTSNPTPDYVERVANTFNKGRYETSDGTVFGTGERCDMQATLAAILLDPTARDLESLEDENFGKVREPIIRVAHMMRTTAKARDVAPGGRLPRAGQLRQGPTATGEQVPFRPYSVFSFFRPGFVPSGTEVASRGDVAPEMQVMTSTHFIDQLRLARHFVRNDKFPQSFYQLDWERLKPLADDPDTLVAYFNETFAAGQFEPATQARMVEALRDVRVQAREPDRGLRQRVEVALLMTMSAPEFMVQR
ncbi:MAG: DUF1800 family protein, partial [Pseudomonadota bacterium]